MQLVVRRLAALVPTLLGVSFVVFMLIRLVPGDPAAVMLGGDAPPDVVQAMRQRLGLDRPLLIQYAGFLRRAVRGDLGYSYFFKDDVNRLILRTLPATVELATVATILAVGIAVPLGVWAATRPNGPADLTASGVAVVGVAMPTFWLGIVLIYFFAVRLRVLPAFGYGGHIWTWAGLQRLVLPAITLAALMLASTARLTRAAMLEVLGEDYIRSARAKGVPGRGVLFHHALRNALIPVVTNVGLQIGNLLGGAVLTETVFAWPGVGRLMVDALFRRYYPLIQGTLLVSTILFVLVNLMVDLAYAAIDPRLHRPGR